MLPYDFFGAEGHSRHENYEYAKRVQQDHSFDFPTHLNIVCSISIISTVPCISYVQCEYSLVNNKIDYRVLLLCAQIGAECNAVRSRVGLVDQSSGGKLYLLGPDAERAAHWLFSAHIPADAGALLSILASSNSYCRRLDMCNRSSCSSSQQEYKCNEMQ